MTEIMPPSHGEARIIDHRLTLLESALKEQEGVSRDNNNLLIRQGADLEHLDGKVGDVKNDLERKVNEVKAELGAKIDKINATLLWLVYSVLGSLIAGIMMFVINGGMRK